MSHRILAAAFMILGGAAPVSVSVSDLSWLSGAGKAAKAITGPRNG
jgi:hypothetical protein